MDTNSLRAVRGLLAAAAVAGLAGVGVAAPTAPATALSLTAPRIGSFSPRTGPAGTKVTITGSDFTKVTAVRFAGAASVFTVRSPSTITATVPAMPSAAGPVTVTARAGTARSRARFTVTPAVRLSAATGPPASVVTVSGTGFGALEGVDVFVDTTDRALAGTGPAGSFGPVTVTIPAAAVPGRHWISAEGRHSRLFAQAAYTVNTNWAQFRYSANHKGSNPYENVLSPSNVARIDQDWTFTTSEPVASSPAVADGVVYVSGGDGNVYALNAATGAERWRFPTSGGTILSSPAVADGVVYVGNDIVYALNAATGAERWHFVPVMGAVESSPAVAGGEVYIGSNDGNVYALNAATGAERWRFHTGAEVLSSPAVAGGVVYIGSDDGNVYALNAATGAELWGFTTGGPVESSPAVANGVVYMGSDDGNVYAFNAATGARLWTFTTGQAVFSSPAVANGVVYIGSLNHNVYALDAATGARLWTFTTGQAVFSSPAVANGVVYISSDDDNLYALNAATGARLWTFTTGGAAFSFPSSTPAVANGVVYIGSKDGNAYAFGLAGGLATPARPNQSNLHPDYSLRPQR